LRNKDLFVRGDGSGDGGNIAIRGNTIFSVPLVLFTHLVFAQRAQYRPPLTKMFIASHLLVNHSRKHTVGLSDKIRSGRYLNDARLGNSGFPSIAFTRLRQARAEKNCYRPMISFLSFSFSLRLLYSAK
jgi:hypothetical protein